MAFMSPIVALYCTAVQGRLRGTVVLFLHTGTVLSAALRGSRRRNNAALALARLQAAMVAPMRMCVPERV